MTAVCVAISVRNGEDYLAEAIESVLAQTHADLELRIYDNLSVDRSAAIARTFLNDPRVSYTANAVDVGYYGSLNRALAETSCPLFVPFAADDVMDRENLAQKAASMERFGAAFACSPVHLIDDGGAIVGELGRPAEPRQAYDAPSFFGLCAPVNCVTCPAVVVDAERLRAIGGFDGRLPYCADWFAWMQLSLRHTVAYVDEHLVRWRQHTDSGTSDSLRSAIYATEDPAALAAVLGDPALPAGLVGARPRMLAACSARMAEHLERDGHARAAAGHAAYAHAARALVLTPGDLGARDRFVSLVDRAGLVRPLLPFHAVALPAPDEIPAAIEQARALDAAGLLASFAVGVRPGLLDQAVRVIEPVLSAAPELGIDLVPDPYPARLLGPGTVALTPFGAPQAAQAESLGVPALPHAMPDPFATPADPERFQKLAAAA